MANRKPVYASTTLTISLAPAGTGLASGSAREATALDVSAGFLDVEVFLKIKLATGTPTAGGGIFFYAGGSLDGTNFSDGLTGSDAAYTMLSPTGLRLIGAQPTPNSGAVTYNCGPYYFSLAFPYLPVSKVSLVILNSTGLAFDGTEGNHTKQAYTVAESVT